VVFFLQIYCKNKSVAGKNLLLQSYVTYKQHCTKPGITLSYFIKCSPTEKCFKLK
jgi:hypothetical protein